ncbi:hypothetical protein EDB81DRAFT_657165 [Dactylonectria macrodidyma]|uniref:Uncharacterized protein n=1 Tax=Dactylonectria macrodidyma TaxID=307937 RepID=A0A9P9IY31_9HYPO|nr:hypothetical protein EDB81DRAFT_657165 [Dactylonectria macrodidyma]
MQSLRLLHHYSTVVFPTLSRDDTVAVWKTAVPEIAFSHEFLMHGLLAMSALHYAQSHPNQRRQYVLVSSYYQNLALQHFSTHLNDINDDNCEALFLLATFIFVITMCSIADRPDSEAPLSPSEVAHSFMLLQGIKTIVNFSHLTRWNEHGPLAPLLQPLPPIKLMRSGPFLVQMDRLTTLAREMHPSFDVINPQSSCLLAIESLRITYHSTFAEDAASGRSRRIWLWPITLTNVFIDLIDKNHPVALIILAHFAALARPFEYQDWINKKGFAALVQPVEPQGSGNHGWTVNIIKAVARSLDHDWQEWMDWPQRSVQECIDVEDMDM